MMKSSENRRFAANNVRDLYPQNRCLSDSDDSRERQLKIDVHRLRRKELIERYPREWNCHRGMLNREGRGLAIVSGDMRRFKDFLLALGPCPADGYTIDRINPCDPQYAKGKVRWASRTTQANNRTNTIMLQHRDGHVKPLAEWARISRQKPDTLRKRYERGWTDAEIITGKRARDVAPVHDSGQRHRSGKWPAIVQDEREWERNWRCLTALRTYRDLSRDECFMWIAINKRRYVEARLADRHPDHFGENADPDYEHGPPLTDDAEYKFLNRLVTAMSEVEARVRRAAHDRISNLIRQYPNIRKADQIPDVIAAERDPYVPPW